MHKLLNIFSANNHQLPDKSVLFILSVTILFLFSNISSVFARSIYVNNISGDDSNSGQTINNPFRTIRMAVSVVNPGDVIHLLNTGSPYKESLILNNRSGTPEARITIDGHGSTILGSEPLNITDWEQVSPGLYKNKIIYTTNRFTMDVVRRYFFLFNGKINRMGRCLKGENLPLKLPSELAENEWTFVSSENAFYLKVSPDISLIECNIECPIRSNAVAVSGDVSFITIRNLICKNVYNDGFGITNTAHNLRFENIQSLYCGDDGISAHASVVFEVDNFISIGNGTGICDTGNSWTSYNNVLIKNCVGVDLYFLNEKPEGQAKHSIKNSVIICNASKSVLLVAKKPEGELSVEMENVLFAGRKNGDSNLQIIGKTKLMTKCCTFNGMNFIIN